MDFCLTERLTIGFERANFKTLLAVDCELTQKTELKSHRNETALETFNYNKQSTKPTGQISEIKELVRNSGSFDEVDVVNQLTYL